MLLIDNKDSVFCILLQEVKVLLQSTRQWQKTTACPNLHQKSQQSSQIKFTVSPGFSFVSTVSTVLISSRHYVSVMTDELLT